MKKTIIPILIIITLILVALVLSKKDIIVETLPLSNQEDGVLSPILSFNWDFEKASTINPDGQPRTNIYLLATYENNISERKLIDTVDGSCSELPGKYEGDISNTGKIQCYSAGLGQQYRITIKENSYSIERKLFEEVLPESQTTDYEWESLVRFSLVKGKN